LLGSLQNIRRRQKKTSEHVYEKGWQQTKKYRTIKRIKKIKRINKDKENLN
jgi:hypothetical protein